MSGVLCVKPNSADKIYNLRILPLNIPSISKKGSLVILASIKVSWLERFERKENHKHLTARGDHNDIAKTLMSLGTPSTGLFGIFWLVKIPE